MSIASEDNRMNHGETRPGWCSVCQLDCRTEAMLVSHSMGKRHKKQIEKQNTGHEGLTQTECPHSREAPEYSAAFEQMWQEISMNKGSTAAGSTEGNNLAQVSQKELESTPASRGITSKEQLKCDLCKISFLSRKCLDAHLAGRRHAARHRTSFSQVEVTSAGATVETDLDMLTGSGKKRCRADFEGEMGQQSNLVASNAVGKGEEQSNKVLLSEKCNSIRHNEEKQGDHFVSSSSASRVADVPVAGQEIGAQQKKEIRCELCGIDCDSQISLQTHFAGRKHAIRLKRSLATDGKQCLNEGEAKYLDAVNGGDKKKKKKSGSEMDSKSVSDCNKIGSDGQDGGSLGENARIEEDRQIRCDLCNIKCSTQRELEWHTLGRRHAAHLKKLAASDVPASVGITGLSGEFGKMVFGKEKPLNASSLNCPDVTHEVKQVSVGAVLGVAGDTVLVGNSKTNVSDETRCDLCNILRGNKYALEEYAIGRKHVPHLEMLLKECACAGEKTFPSSETLAGTESKTEREQLFSGLCGTNCFKKTDGNSIFNMHAMCLLKLLTLDEKVRVGAVEAMIRETQIAREREAISHQLVSLWEREGIQTEEQKCTVCHIKCSSKKDLDGHLAGKKHATQLKKLRGRCELCDVYCGTKKALKCHMAGKKHAAKVKLITGERGGIDASDMSLAPRHENSGNSEDALKVVPGPTQMGQTVETLVMNKSLDDGIAGDKVTTVEEFREIGQTDEPVLMERDQGEGNPENILKIPVETAQMGETDQIVQMDRHQDDGSPKDMLRMSEEYKETGQTSEDVVIGQTDEPVLMERDQGEGNPQNILKIPVETVQMGETGQTVQMDRHQDDGSPKDMLRMSEECKETGQTSEDVVMERQQCDYSTEDVLKISERFLQTRQAGESFEIKASQGEVNSKVLKISEETTNTGHPVQNPEDVLKILEESSQTGHPGDAP